ncbi:uncharacterized protein BDV17DRAFT_300794 [Aspergillus undulatus]|uniref:uncharacterized protein n=1 Tax=Aspergillus undulatus TaxID=1810928 RepID=UPI003CCD4712
MDRPPPAKRPRLSMACNICRQRKVKCDAEYPKCRNCRVRNQVCITTDPHRPGCPGVREWLELPDKVPNGTDGTEAQRPQNEVLSPDQTQPPVPEAQVDAKHGAENEVSPVRQPFDTSVNTEQGTNRTKILGGSSSQCLAKSLDVYFKAVRMKPVSSFFRHGMRHAEELDIPLALLLPELPASERVAQFLSVYNSRIRPLYPIFDLDALSSSIHQLATISNLRALPRDDIPILVTAYLVTSIGLDERAQCPTEEGDRYLHAAASLLAHIIVVPYLPTVQALLLFTIAYRGHNQEGLAWQHLGMAIRISYTLGLHRPSKSANGQCSLGNLQTRIWATCCSFEKMMHLASGWPTLIPDELMARPEALDENNDRFLRWHLGLARYQGRISHHLYNHPSTAQPSHLGRPNGSRSIRQILLDTARLDRDLLEWANLIPSELRPGNDIICSADEFHIVAFLSIEYHGSMIALHRAALIAPKSKIEDEVAKHCPDDPSRHRLANGESICVNSARAIAKLSIELQDGGSDSCLIPAGTAGLACIAIAIYLMKHPTSRLQAADMQLLKACLSYSSTQFAQCNIDPRYIEGLAVIYEQIHARLEGNISDLAIASPLSRQRRQCSKNDAAADTGNKPRPNSHPFVALPTPSTYESATPVTTRSLNPERSNGFSQGLTQRRAQSFSYNIPDSTNGLHIDWSDPVHDVSVNNTAGTLLDPVAGSDPGDLPPAFDEVYPFEGFNVEDLWNWMLYFDSPKSTDAI